MKTAILISLFLTALFAFLGRWILRGHEHDGDGGLAWGLAAALSWILAMTAGITTIALVSVAFCHH